MGSAKTPKVASLVTIATVIAGLLYIGFSIYNTLSRDVASLVRKEQQLREVLSLHTAEYLYRDVIYVGEQTRVFGFHTRDQHLLFAIQLRVRAGVDLQSPDFSIYSEGIGRNRTTFVTLPPATVFSVDADERTIHEYFSGGRGLPVTMLSYFEEIHAAKQMAQQDAEQRGILTLAEGNAHTIIRNLLQASGNERIVIHTENF